MINTGGIRGEAVAVKAATEVAAKAVAAVVWFIELHALPMNFFL